MSKFYVTVKLVRTVDIAVEAESMAAAKKQIEDYGPDLAMVDYDDVGEYPQRCRVVRVSKSSPARIPLVEVEGR